MEEVIIALLEDEDRDQFIKENQESFRYGAMEEFGLRDDHFEEEGEIISRKTIEDAIQDGIAYRILQNGRKVGGLVLRIEGTKGFLDLLFVSPREHSKGIGCAAWHKVEEKYPQIEVWETCTPYFEKRNIHFYVNRLGFYIVEFFNGKHPDPHEPNGNELDEMFRFEKRMR